MLTSLNIELTTKTLERQRKLVPYSAESPASVSIDETTALYIQLGKTPLRKYIGPDTLTPELKIVRNHTMRKLFIDTGRAEH